MKLAILITLLIYQLSSLGRAQSGYDTWAAQLEPGMIIQTIQGEGNTCHCKVPTTSSTSAITAPATTTTTTETPTPTGKPKRGYYSQAACNVDLVTSPTTDTHWRSPNYPSNYPDGATCNLTVTMPEDMQYSVITLTPSSDSFIYGTPYCRHDHLKYITSEGVVIRYCQLLQGITVVSNVDVPKKFSLRFESTTADGNMTARGFDFHIKVINSYG
ncbi:uncharacterized protein [Palaemon carinicauda]|uniref:uncharacterized protein isoform X2 n=1 Tax=Palaemon carinicauda TaxID=392227 RepID=UPI0035B6149A